MSRAVLIYNPVAGPQFPSSQRRTDPDWLTDTVAYLERQGGVIEAVAAESPQAISAIARRAASESAELVIAAGGDGTLRAVADGLAGTQTALGILPRGTVNVFARECGIPLDDLRAACDLCLAGTIRRLDLGRIDGHHKIKLMISNGRSEIADMVHPFNNRSALV